MRKMYIVTDIHDNSLGLGQQNKLEDLLRNHSSIFYKAAVLSQAKKAIQESGNKINKIYLEGISDYFADKFVRMMLSGKMKRVSISDKIEIEFLKTVVTNETEILGAENFYDGSYALQFAIKLPEKISEIIKTYNLAHKKKTSIPYEIFNGVSEYVKPLSAKLTRKRDATFASKINKTLEADEAGVLMIGKSHHPEKCLERDIELKRFEMQDIPDIFEVLYEAIKTSRVKTGVERAIPL